VIFLVEDSLSVPEPDEEFVLLGGELHGFASHAHHP
jgi:hypothetical protein